MMPLELKKSDLSLRPKLHFDQLPLRNLDVLKEKHLDHERIPSNVSLLKIIWTVLAASYFVVRSEFRN